MVRIHVGQLFVNQVLTLRMPSLCAQEQLQQEHPCSRRFINPHRSWCMDASVFRGTCGNLRKRQDSTPDLDLSRKFHDVSRRERFFRVSKIARNDQRSARKTIILILKRCRPLRDSARAILIEIEPIRAEAEAHPQSVDRTNPI